MGAWAADVADWWGEEFSVWGLEFRVQGLGGVLWVAGDGDVRLGCWGAGFGGLGVLGALCRFSRRVIAGGLPGSNDSLREGNHPIYSGLLSGG